jgi:hypothetical protein
MKKEKANWIDHIWRRNCLLKHVIEGKVEGIIEVTGRRRRRSKQLLPQIDSVGTGSHCVESLAFEEAVDLR